MVKEARASGFDNVHDYLIYLKTKETQEQIAKRKHTFDWGAWLSVDLQDGEATETDVDISLDETENSIKGQLTRRRTNDTKLTGQVNTRSRGLRIT